MADEDEYAYVPNNAVMSAVQASGGVQGASGLGPTRGSMSYGVPDAPRSRPDFGNLRPKARAAAEHAFRQEQAQAAHNAALESVARAHLALEENNKYYQNAKTRNELVQQANQLNQSANFFAEHANLNPYSPDYYQHVNALAAKYPGATENKSVQAILTNPKLREQAALKGDVPGEVATRNAFKGGWLKQEDLNNPQLRNQDGSFNHDAASELAALREGASVEPPHVKTARAGMAEVNRLGTDLTPQQEGLRDMYSNTIYQFEKSRQATLGISQPVTRSAASFFPRSQPATAPQEVQRPYTQKGTVVGAPVPADRNLYGIQPAVIGNPNAPRTPAAPLESIPPAPPPPTPAPQISSERAAAYMRQYNQ